MFEGIPQAALAMLALAGGVLVFAVLCVGLIAALLKRVTPARAIAAADVMRADVAQLRDRLLEQNAGLATVEAQWKAAEQRLDGLIDELDAATDRLERKRSQVSRAASQLKEREEKKVEAAAPPPVDDLTFWRKKAGLA